eukprot:6179026-Pleurochrysis_carterae.AAC.1
MNKAQQAGERGGALDDDESVHSDGEYDWASLAEDLDVKALGDDHGGTFDDRAAHMQDGVNFAAHEPSRRRAPCPKPRTKAQFPARIKDARNFETSNIIAAQAPWQESAPRKGGKRDAMRANLEEHYSSADRSFSRSFVVGPLNDVCATAFWLACGLTVQTYQIACADCRMQRPTHKGRIPKRDAVESQERSHLNAYIRHLRETMEGDKGSGTHGHWYTGSRTIKMRWNDYK